MDDLLIMWTCSGCGHVRHDTPGYNGGGRCHCGGEYEETGHSYPVEDDARDIDDARDRAEQDDYERYR